MSGSRTGQERRQQGIVGEAFRVPLGWACAIYGTLLLSWLIWVALALWRLGSEQD